MSQLGQPYSKTFYEGECDRVVYQQYLNTFYEGEYGRVFDQPYFKTFYESEHDCGVYQTYSKSFYIVFSSRYILSPFYEGKCDRNVYQTVPLRCVYQSLVFAKYSVYSAISIISYATLTYRHMPH